MLSIIPILVITFFAIIDNFSFKNIAYRITTIFLVAVLLILSIKQWSAYMANEVIHFKFYINLVGLCVLGIAIICGFSFLLYQLFSKRNIYTRIAKLVLLLFIILVVRNFI